MTTKNFFTITATLTIFLTILSINAEFVIKGKVNKRNTIISVHNDTPPPCFNNNSIFKNKTVLRNTVIESRYIFTGKISSVSKRKVKKTKLYVFKVLIRRVLKGDLGVFSEILNFETRTSNSTNRAYVLAEGGAWRRGCASAQGWPALLFTSGEVTSSLKLLIDPVPLNLDYARQVKGIIKGKKKKQ